MNNNNVIGNIILEATTSAHIEDVVVKDTGSKIQRVEATGVLQDLDVENRNKRIYAKKDMEPEINGPRMKELIKAGYMCGETGHPLSDSLVRQQTIDPKLVCVRFNKIWLEDNLIKANFQGTNNEYGETFDSDLRDGRKPAFSLRALGSIENVGGKAYVRGIRVITWDHVIFPSHRAAYTSGLLTESAISNGADNSTLSIKDFNEYNNDAGKIIKIYGNDAKDMLNRLQRESANISTILETFEGIADKVTYNNGYVTLTNRFGEKFNIRLEQYVDNLIMNWVG